MKSAEQVIAAFVQQANLPPSFTQIAHDYYLPLAIDIAERRKPLTQCIGVHGCQGSGKSTITELLAVLLRELYACSVATLSLDDLYLTRQARRQLAVEQHPLLATRGVPGTHDVALGIEVINSLRTGSGDVALPRFDKSTDDRAPTEAWPKVAAPVDIILFEGWCLGTPPQTAAALKTPVNALEQDEDSDGVWRGYVNRQLESVYPALFAQVDWLLMLQAPDFECVHRWRRQQEEALVARTGISSPLLEDSAMLRFISHYERLTRHSLATVPALADCVIRLDAGRKPLSVTF